MPKQRRNRCGYSVRYPVEERAYRSMWNRCMNPNYISYPKYGGRGIKICDRWLGYYGLQNFVDDMGERPEGCSLDRIDVDGDYSPENCRWATASTQSFNRRDWSGHRGVRKVEYMVRGKFGPYVYWVAYISFKGKKKSKTFKTEEEAIAQRKEWEKEIPLG